MLSAALSPGVIAAPNLAPVWLPQVVSQDEAPHGNPQVVFLGDSITSGYGYSPAWAAGIAPLGARDLAIGGSTTQNVLWQLDSGVLSGTAPRVVVLMVGINNLGTGQTPEQTAAGVAADVAALRLSQPQARILLLGILPAGPMPDTLLRQEIAQTNGLIAGLADGSAVHFLDIGANFLQADGTISPAVMADYLHPTNLGYNPMTTAIGQPLLTLFLEGPLSVPTPTQPALPTLPVQFSNPLSTEISAPVDPLAQIAHVLPGVSEPSATALPQSAPVVSTPALPPPAPPSSEAPITTQGHSPASGSGESPPVTESMDGSTAALEAGPEQPHEAKPGTSADEVQPPEGR